MHSIGSEKQRVTRPVTLVCSTGRTGTRFFGIQGEKLINDSYSTHEPDVLMGLTRETFTKALKYGPYNTVLGRILGRTGLRNIAMRYSLGELSDEQAARQIMKQRSRIYEESSKTLYLEAYPQWALLLSIVPKVFENYRIVALVRHPVSYIGSMSDHTSVSQLGWRGLQNVSAVRKRMFRKLRPSDLGVERRGVTQNSVAWYLAWEWAFWTDRIVKSVASDPHARIYRFEDIFDKQDRSVRSELLEFASHDAGTAVEPSVQDQIFSQAVNAAPRSTVRDWSSYTPELQDEIVKLCAPLADHFDYELS